MQRSCKNSETSCAPYNLTPGRASSHFVVHTSEADNVYDPLCGSFVGDQGAEHGKTYFTMPPTEFKASLRSFQAPGLPNQIGRHDGLP